MEESQYELLKIQLLDAWLAKQKTIRTRIACSCNSSIRTSKTGEQEAHGELDGRMWSPENWNKENEIENRLTKTSINVTGHRLFLNRTRREDGGL